MGFVGAKSGAGVYQRIICWIPPHDLYVEPFAGTAAIWRNKRAAGRSILIDRDPGALDRIGGGDLTDVIGGDDVEMICGDGIDFLRRFRPPASQRAFVYADPPYLRETRRDPDRDYYRHEWTREDHERFLDVVDELEYPVLVSGYWSDLYGERLQAWHTDRFQATTRGGVAEEWLWANYPRPERLHDYRWIGADFGQRWKIHKRQRNWLRALQQMPPLERRAMLSAIGDYFSDEWGDGRSTLDAGGGGRGLDPSDGNGDDGHVRGPDSGRNGNGREVRCE